MPLMWIPTATSSAVSAVYTQARGLAPIYGLASKSLTQSQWGKARPPGLFMHVCTSKSQGEPAARSGPMLRSSRNPFLPVRCVVTLHQCTKYLQCTNEEWQVKRSVNCGVNSENSRGGSSSCALDTADQSAIRALTRTGSAIHSSPGKAEGGAAE
ncbi:hypothetical protein J1605_008969 [Eschrichtius robustus]|uniref:Uncharacterized protein n=1 Tax=Eschrichtius robustus TaxID=9764 RepID=A0AB34GTW5_ESCRO|nr:hypothetical protein J1605_008969 [Eschrichtius robustus]